MREKGIVLVVDQGTTGTRVALYDKNGSPIPGGWAYREHSQIYPKPGWVEHNPLEIWEKTLLCIKEALERSRVDPGAVAAIGVTNQRETVVVWDPRTGQSLYNAIVWQDRRTAPVTDALRENYFETIYEKTGLVPDPYFSGSKIQWLLENVSGLREKVSRGEAIFGTIDTWIIWNLTKGSPNTLTPEKGGAHVTDYSNASRTMLFNIRRLEWDEELLSILGGIPAESLPLPRPSSDKEVYGYTGPEVGGVFNGYSIPVTGDAGDQQAALFGQAGFDAGEVKCTYGTGNFILVNTGSQIVKSKNNLLSTVFYSLEPGKATYALEGSIFVTGAAIQWLRDGLKIIEVSPEVDPLAESADDTGGLYFVPAFTGLGAPYWDPYARGLIIGITRGTTRRHLARAVLESIAYLTRDVIEAMERDTGSRIKWLKADGGASRSDVLLQFQADILGVEVIRPLVRETTSLGAAFLAGLAIGFWENLDAIKKLWRAEKVFKPQMDAEKRERLYSGWRAAVRRALGWAREVPWAYGY
ncbi:glycerol kinase GlpK [Infirmifilum lucidum]|uniref:Glycerol kinase n=1 Tax=Infirmifilum lucidum TaxID=2776706 RepID=A0A7L9FHG7_9CREN|nr:glycerol kinase GlpK [Infirmifilum lucidum]QOJ79209.1 glycerol kinase GlpK [Infirmifilum lucidum]